MKQPKEKQQPYQDSLKRNIIRDYFLKSEARSEMNMQELKTESADMALREWLQAEFGSLQQEKLELEVSRRWKNRKIAVMRLRTRQLRADDLSRQEPQESQSTVNQLTVPIQELQDGVNSLNDSRDFHDPEKASSSGPNHVPSHPSTVLLGKPCRDSSP